MKYYLVHFVTTLNAAFERKLALEDYEGYEMVAKILTYQLHLEEHPRFMMFPVPRMHPLTQTQSHHAA